MQKINSAAVFFTLVQCCSMNDSSQQWLTRPVSSPQVTVNSWKIGPLLCRSKNKAPHPQSRAPRYTDREGEGVLGSGPATSTWCSRTKHQTMPSRDLSLPLVGVHYSVWTVKFGAEILQWTHHKNRQECRKKSHHCIILYLPAGASHWLTNVHFKQHMGMPLQLIWNSPLSSPACLIIVWLADVIGPPAWETSRSRAAALLFHPGFDQTRW